MRHIFHGNILSFVGVTKLASNERVPPTTAVPYVTENFFIAREARKCTIHICLLLTYGSGISAISCPQSTIPLCIYVPTCVCPTAQCDHVCWLQWRVRREARAPGRTPRAPRRRPRRATAPHPVSAACYALCCVACALRA